MNHYAIKRCSFTKNCIEIKTLNTYNIVRVRINSNLRFCLQLQTFANKGREITIVPSLLRLPSQRNERDLIKMKRGKENEEGIQYFNDVHDVS